jgi:glycosyltransferase involved in cell wall biosynthesis
MKVSFIGTRGVPASYSGFETCVEQLGCRLAGWGHQVTVFCRTGHYAKRPAMYRGMHLRYVPSVQQKHLDTLTHTARSALLLDPDSAVICMGVGNAPVVRILELRGRCTVFNVDGPDWQRKKWGSLASWYLRQCERLAATGRSILVADAGAVRDYYATQFGRASELVTYGAEPPSDRDTDTLEQFGLKSGNYLLFVGRLVPENASHDFLAAVTEARLNVPAVVVGDAPYAKQYIAGLRESAPANTVFTGYQFGNPYQQLTAHAGAFILAATVGGTHPVLVEQMAAGNCILARDTASNREVLGHAGIFWDDPGDLTNQLRTVWHDADLRRRLGEAAARRAGERYNWDTVARRYVALCELSLATRGRVRAGRV